MSSIELLAPAGDREKLESAFRFGADAVYLGGKAFNLRARSHNFSLRELADGVAYAHGIGKKVYVTLNSLAHDREIRSMPKFVKFLSEIGVDAVIVSDLGVIDLVNDFSKIDIHVSTQSSVTNWRAAKVLQKLGVKRIVLAREVSLRDIVSIREHVPEMELEVFVHGSMCMAYSGRCQLSHYLAERDGNRGACTNTCRWKYQVVEEKRPGEYFPVYEDETGSYIFNSKDLCTIEILDKILETGVCSLKIEGRMKSSLYVATTTGVYRSAIDTYLKGDYQVDPAWLAELQTVSNRGYTRGFYVDARLADHNNRDGGYRCSHEFVGIVDSIDEHDTALVHIRGPVSEGEIVELVRPQASPFSLPMPPMFRPCDFTKIAKGGPGTSVFVNAGNHPFRAGDLLRKRVVHRCIYSHEMRTKLNKPT